MHVLRLLLILALLTLLGQAGCRRSGGPVVGDETNDPVYQQAHDLKKQGRYNEALNGFLKVISRRGESGAPESHLEAGALYLNWSHNPIEAYHHFSRYLELQPTGPRSSIVRGQREAAMREIARFLMVPANAVGGGLAQRSEEVEALRRRVQELEAENQTLRGSTGLPVLRPAPMIALPDEGSPDITPAEVPVAEVAATTVPGGNDSTSFTRNLGTATASRQPVPVTPRPSPAATPTTSRTTTQLPVAAAARPSGYQPPPAATDTRVGVPTRPGAPQRPSTSATAPGGRRHTVGANEKSLWGIARQYYGGVNQARVNALFEANRDVMRNPNDLRAGMVLRIP